MEKQEVFAIAHAIATANRHPDPDSYAQTAADSYVAPGDTPAPSPAPETPAA